MLLLDKYLQTSGKICHRMKRMEVSIKGQPCMAALKKCHHHMLARDGYSGADIVDATATRTIVNWGRFAKGELS